MVNFRGKNTWIAAFERQESGAFRSYLGLIKKKKIMSGELKEVGVPNGVVEPRRLVELRRKRRDSTKSCLVDKIDLIEFWLIFLRC